MHLEVVLQAVSNFDAQFWYSRFVEFVSTEIGVI